MRALLLLAPLVLLACGSDPAPSSPKLLAHHPTSSATTGSGGAGEGGNGTGGELATSTATSAASTGGAADGGGGAGGDASGGGGASESGAGGAGGSGGAGGAGGSGGAPACPGVDGDACDLGGDAGRCYAGACYAACVENHDCTDAGTVCARDLAGGTCQPVACASADIHDLRCAPYNAVCVSNACERNAVATCEIDHGIPDGTDCSLDGDPGRCYDNSCWPRCTVNGDCGSTHNVCVAGACATVFCTVGGSECATGSTCEAFGQSHVCAWALTP